MDGSLLYETQGAIVVSHQLHLMRALYRHSLHKKDLEGDQDVRLAGVYAQLQTLGDDHIGYSSKRFPQSAVSLVGARPFSAVCLSNL